jgi:hypothetical protein
LWQQAAAQGQTSFVSAGDGGPAGCDDFNDDQQAQYGIAMNGFSSTPWNVSMGDLPPIFSPGIMRLSPVFVRPAA